MSLSELAAKHLENMRRRALFTTTTPDANDEDFAPLCLYLHHQASAMFDLWKETFNVTEYNYVESEEGPATEGEGLPIEIAKIALSALAILHRLDVMDDGDLEKLLAVANQLDKAELDIIEEPDGDEDLDEEPSPAADIESVIKTGTTDAQLTAFFKGQGVPLANKE